MLDPTRWEPETRPLVKAEKGNFTLNTQIRYDSIWRRIKGDDYAAKLEGQFRDSYERLGELNNWGSLGWLYPHATATKLAHHHGVEHNALHFLGVDEERERHRPSFRIASHTLHWGHLPLSYAGAEAVIRAIHVDPKARKVIDGIFQDVVDFGHLTCRNPEGHDEDCAETVLNGTEPFELYKWLSAWLLSKRWKKVWAAVRPLIPEDARDEANIKRAAVRTLVCREDTGYELLDLCRLADYVPRDLQQAGTAWLTVDIEALWETSPIRPDRAQEWNLLLAAKRYLEERFFVSPDAQLVHSLASRTIAQGLLNKGITRENLLNLLTASAGDAHYSRFLSEHYRRRLREEVIRPTKLKTLHRSWSHIGTFDRVHIPAMSRLAAEDHFSKRVGTGRLSYPMTSNFSVLVQPESRGFLEPGSVESQRVAVTVHHRQESGLSAARPALDIALDVRRHQSTLRREVPSSLAAWISNERIELRSRPLRDAAGRALAVDETRVRKQLAAIVKQAPFSPQRDLRGEGRTIARLLTRPKLPRLGVATRVLELPLSTTRSNAGKSLLEALRTQALAQAEDQSDPNQGASLEVAVAADQLLSEDDCSRRMLILGATALASEGQPIVEWDVWRLDLLKGGDWRLVAVECSITASTKKEEEDRAKLERLWNALHKRFSDLSEYRTLFSSATDGKLHYEDASRGFKRDP
jgi:hypothetical protein